jgi:hypothetical protein
MEILFDPSPRPTCGVLPRFTQIARLMMGMAGILMALLISSTGELRAQTPQGRYNVKLAWKASTGEDVTGYRIHYGTTKGTYTSSIAVGNVTSGTVSGLAEGVTYHFVVSAFNAAGLESGFSNELSLQPGLHGSQVATAADGQKFLFIQGLIGRQYDIEASADLKTWTRIATVTIPEGGSMKFTDPDAASHPMRFYRTHPARSDPSNEVGPKPELRIAQNAIIAGWQKLLFLRGQTGSRYDIEASVDLRTWSLIATVTMPEGGSMKFADPDAASHPMRFYRARPNQIDPSNEASPMPKLDILLSGIAAGWERFLVLRGQTGSQYDIEASVDLRTWILIATVTMPEGGSMKFTDPDAAAYPMRFYRTRQRITPPG